MAESRLQRRIRGALEERFEGSFWFKVHGNRYTPIGMPDLLGCVEGYYCALEIKVLGKEPTPIQYTRMEQLKDAGAIVGWVNNVEDAVDLIRQSIREKQEGS